MLKRMYSIQMNPVNLLLVYRQNKRGGQQRRDVCGKLHWPGWRGMLFKTAIVKVDYITGIVLQMSLITIKQ